MEQNQNSIEFVPTTQVLEATQKSKQMVFDTPEQQIEEAEKQKQLGNEQFKQKQYKNAFKHYYKVLLYVNGFLNKDDDMYQYGNKGVRIEDPKIIEKINNLRQTTYLNMAQIDLYNKNYEKAITRINDSFKVKKSVKGFYRRGCAYLELNDLDNAEKDFKNVIEMDPNFTQIENQMLLLKKKRKIQDKQLQQKFSNMFSKE